MQMDIIDDNDMSQKFSVSIKSLDEHINSTTRSAYTYEPGSLNKQYN